MFKCNNVIKDSNNFEGSSTGISKFSTIHVKTEHFPHETCRICLKEGKLFIFAPNGSTVLSDAINDIGGVQVNPEDPYPKFLCQSCHSLLQGAILFRKTALSSDSVLKNLELNCVDISVSDEKDIIIEQKCDDNIELKERLLKTVKLDTNSEIDDFQDDHLDSDDYVCDKKTRRRSKQQWIKCFTCNTNFYTFAEFTKHRNVCRKIVLTCAICSKIFKKYQDFAYHKRSEHEKQNTPNMSQNPEETKTTKRKSKEKPMHVCDICGKTFATKGIFMRHRSVHFNEKPYKCPMCNYRCRIKSSLKRHQVIHFDELPFKCPLCPYRSRLKESVTMHMRSHTGEKPYQCEQCPSRFVSKSNLSKHMLRHREHGFCCEICSKGYYTKSDLENHIKDDHTDGKRHSCRFCEKSFTHRNAMMKHERKVHKRKNLVSGTMPIYLKLATVSNEGLTYANKPNLGVQSET